MNVNIQHPATFTTNNEN